MSRSVTRWPDGQFRKRSSWEPELLELLWQECSARNISALEFLQILPSIDCIAPDEAIAAEVWAAECDRLGYPDKEIEEVQS